MADFAEAVEQNRMATYFIKTPNPIMLQLVGGTSYRLPENKSFNLSLGNRRTIQDEPHDKLEHIGP